MMRPLSCGAGRRCRGLAQDDKGAGMTSFKLGVLEISPVGADADFHYQRHSQGVDFFHCSRTRDCMVSTSLSGTSKTSSS